MSSYLLNIIIQTIPKVPANEYQEAKLIVKPRNAWKNDIFKFFVILITALISLFIFDKIPIPYLGNVFVLYGVFGSISGIIFGLRAFIIFKHYFDIFEEDTLKKLEQ